ncbi:Zona pellucida sperm-binding protein 4 [Acipenser ruthenus]|uniref:Zona pellucida sperm-binding protein 4 n=1 Tax=Acipenser ruthenus TaxID=7906 RepID=A0A444UV31_ACIRT|nr:Zona pellucida sperm-binding protein 4 [Acipenser ruthenus]
MVKCLFTGACARLGVWLLITGVTVFRVQAQRLRSRDAGVPVTCSDGYMEVAVTPSEFGGTTITFNIRDIQEAHGLFLGEVEYCNFCNLFQRNGSDVVYENLMSAFIDVRTGPGGSITRDSTYKLLLQCRYAGNKSVPLQAVVYTIAPPPPVAAQGPLRVELRIAREQSYGSYYTSLDYPVTYVLREPVYVEVRILERTDTNIVLTLDDCWATSTPSPLGKPQWNLLVDGCPYRDDNYLTSLVPVDAATSRLPNPTHYKRFVLKMFAFVNPFSRQALKEMIYIHCSAAVCYPSVMDSCVKRCIAKNIQEAHGLFLGEVEYCNFCNLFQRNGSDVVYENLMSAFIDVRTGPGGSITRDSTYKLLLQCRYAGNKSVPLQAVVYTIAPPPPVAAQGPLRVELRIAREQSYGSYYTSLDYPVTYVLREPVYVEVRILERTDTNIVLTLDDCWATSTPSPLGKPQWNLLVDGCPYRDDNYLTSLVPVDAATSRLPNPTHYKRFVLKMFTFVDPVSRRALKEMVGF